MGGAAAASALAEAEAGVSAEAPAPAPAPDAAHPLTSEMRRAVLWVVAPVTTAPPLAGVVEVAAGSGGRPEDATLLSSPSVDAVASLMIRSRSLRRSMGVAMEA